MEEDTLESDVWIRYKKGAKSFSDNTMKGYFKNASAPI